MWSFQRGGPSALLTAILAKMCKNVWRRSDCRIALICSLPTSRQHQQQETLIDSSSRRTHTEVTDTLFSKYNVYNNKKCQDTFVRPLHMGERGYPFFTQMHKCSPPHTVHKYCSLTLILKYTARKLFCIVNSVLSYPTIACIQTINIQ